MNFLIFFFQIGIIIIFYNQYLLYFILLFKNSQMLRFDHLEEQKGLFTFYKEQDQQQYQYSHSSYAQASLESQNKASIYGRKQTDESVHNSNEQSEQVKSVYKFLANCVSKKRKNTVPAVQIANDDDEGDSHACHTKNYENFVLNSKKDMQEDVILNEQFKKFKKVNNNSSKIKTEEIYNLKNKHSKNSRGSKVIYKVIRLKMLSNPISDAEVDAKSQWSQIFQNKSIHRDHSQRDSSGTRKSYVPKKMLDFEEKQNKQRKILEELDPSKSKLIQRQYISLSKAQNKTKKHKRTKDAQIYFSENKLNKKNSRLPLHDLSIKPKQINSFEDRLLILKDSNANKSEHISLKLPELPNNSARICPKMKKKPLLLTEKIRNKFPDCLLGNVHKERKRSAGKVKKLRQGNSVVMLDHIKDEIMDGWQKRKIQFLKQMMVRNSLPQSSQKPNHE